VYPIATFPHGNRLPAKSKGKEADSKQPEPKVTEA
jgi:hypothetical protein